MKKAILPILLLFVGVSCLLAVESDPSQTVGFIKYTVPQGYTYFCLPFTFQKLTGTPPALVETMAPDDVVGNELTGGTISGNSDRIVNIYTGTAGYIKASDGKWYNMAAFIDNVPYFFQHRAATTLSVYLAGAVVREAQTVGTFNPGSKLCALREAGAVPVGLLDLNPNLAGGFHGGAVAGQSDQLINPNNGNVAWYKTSSSAWQGALTATIPGLPLYVLVRSTHTPIVWNYDPNTRAAAAPTTLNVNNK